MARHLIGSGARRNAFTREQWIDHLQRLALAEQRACPVPELQDKPAIPDYLTEVRRVVRHLSRY
jgi:hypothetical protein